MGWGGVVCLIIVSTPGRDLSRSRLGLVMLVTTSAKARFGQVGDQVSQVRDQVGQGQGQELDNNWLGNYSVRALSTCFYNYLLGKVSYICTLNPQRPECYKVIIPGSKFN